MSKIVCVVPSIRPESMKTFREAWAPLFEKHSVTLITVWDGEKPKIECSLESEQRWINRTAIEWGDLFCRFTDGCRNAGFRIAAQFNPDYILTLDDDVVPLPTHIEDKPNPRYPCSTMRWSADPIQSHLDVLQKRVPISWMNTAHDTDLYLRGFPYGIREEAPVMLSHGVWVGTPDFDGETQLKLEQTLMEKHTSVGHLTSGGVPYSLPYFVGPIPRGVSFPLCGMNVMVRREALPYFYFAPMGPDAMKCRRCDGDGKAHGADRPFESSGKGDYPGPCPVCLGSRSPLHRFADIFMGIHLKQSFDWRNWACYTGASTVLHTRASDAKKNMEQEKLGREWLELMRKYEPVDSGHPMVAYFQEYRRKRERYETLVKNILGIKEKP